MGQSVFSGVVVLIGVSAAVLVSGRVASATASATVDAPKAAAYTEAVRAFVDHDRTISKLQLDRIHLTAAHNAALADVAETQKVRRAKGGTAAADQQQAGRADAVLGDVNYQTDAARVAAADIDAIGTALDASLTQLLAKKVEACPGASSLSGDPCLTDSALADAFDRRHAESEQALKDARTQATATTQALEALVRANPSGVSIRESVIHTSL